MSEKAKVYEVSAAASRNFASGEKSFHEDVNGSLREAGAEGKYYPLGPDRGRVVIQKYQLEGTATHTRNLLDDNARVTITEERDVDPQQAQYVSGAGVREYDLTPHEGERIYPPQVKSALEGHEHIAEYVPNGPMGEGGVVTAYISEGLKYMKALAAVKELGDVKPVGQDEEYAKIKKEAEKIAAAKAAEEAEKVAEGEGGNSDEVITAEVVEREQDDS